MFKGNRGMVLRTLAAGFALVGANETRTSVPKGTRVKFMSDIGDGKIRVKVKDGNLAKGLQGAHMEITAKGVTKVDRGRPEGEEGAKRAVRKPAAKKAAAKKGGAKKSAAKKATSKPKAAAKAATPAPAADDDLDLSSLDKD